LSGKRVPKIYHFFVYVKPGKSMKKGSRVQSSIFRSTFPMRSEYGSMVQVLSTNRYSQSANGKLSSAFFLPHAQAPDSRQP
jgi:hypothetical protein